VQKKIKVIFLDIDGVMNSRNGEIQKHDLLLEKYGDSEKIPWWESIQLDSPAPNHIEQLNRIVEETNAVVVISSSWRENMSSLMWNRFFCALGFKGEIIGETPRCYNRRGIEIETWIKKHDNVQSFVILDDDDDMEPYMNKLVLCNNCTGLTNVEAEKAIKILNFLE
jgi:hypothetical protein